MKKVIIFGTGYFGRLVHVYLSKDSRYEIAAFTLNEAYITDRNIMGVDVVPFETIQDTYPPDKYTMFIAVGYQRVNQARAEIYNLSKEKGYELISYINSKVTQWGEIVVGDNCFIFENNVIQPFVKIGNDVIMWSGNHLGHDSIIEDHCFIASHAVISGNVTIGAHCFIGVNATVRDKIKVAPNCIIGAGALILKDTKYGEVYAGQGTKPRDISSSQIEL